MGTVWDIERWIDAAALSAIKRFYPTALTRNISLPLQEIFYHLVRLVEQKKLKLYWEIRCPECFSTVDVKDLYVATGEELECPLGHEFELRADYVFPVFEISDEYRSYVIENKKKQKHQGTSILQETRILRYKEPVS